MSNLLTVIIIGLIAGLIDSVPMIFMKLSKTACLSAFFHYFVLGVVIPFVDWGIQPWLTGLIISVLSAIPVMLIVIPGDKKSAVPMSVFAVILGIAIGYFGGIFVS